MHVYIHIYRDIVQVCCSKQYRYPVYQVLLLYAVVDDDDDSVVFSSWLGCTTPARGGQCRVPTPECLLTIWRRPVTLTPVRRSYPRQDRGGGKRER